MRFEAIHRGGRIARRFDHFKLRTDAAGKLATEDRLGQEVADAQAHALGARVQIVPRGNHDDWYFRGHGIAPERLHDLEAVHPGHHEVEENNVNFVFMHQFETLLSGVGLYRDKAFTLQMPGEDCDGVLIVVNHHYLWRPDCFIHTIPNPA